MSCHHVWWFCKFVQIHLELQREGFFSLWFLAHSPLNAGGVVPSKGIVWEGGRHAVPWIKPQATVFKFFALAHWDISLSQREIIQSGHPVLYIKKKIKIVPSEQPVFLGLYSDCFLSLSKSSQVVFANHWVHQRE